MMFQTLFRGTKQTFPIYHTPATSVTLISSAGVLSWGMFVAGRKIKDSKEFRQDMSAVSGTCPVAREARFRLYDMDEDLKNNV